MAHVGCFFLNKEEILPGEDWYYPEVGAVPEHLFKVIESTDGETILVGATAKHRRSERF